MTCTNAATFGVTTHDQRFCTCSAHLPQAVQQGGYVQPLPEGYTCELPRKHPFGFSKDAR
jgi:hypothetical protein